MQRKQADPIKHVIVLMLENRSFDQMLGSFQRVYPSLDGVDEVERRSNADGSGRQFFQITGAKNVIEDDPHHDLHSVLRQIGADPAVPGTNPFRSKFRRVVRAVRRSDPAGWIKKLWRANAKGEPLKGAMAAAYTGDFVGEYARCYPNIGSERLQQVMSFFDLDTLPALHTLARHFRICDHWFSSVPGPTWANRFFFHTGTALGTTWMPEKASDITSATLFDQETIYDKLTHHDKNWRIYFHDFPQSLALSNMWTKENRKRFSMIDEFEADVRGRADAFPDFVFIEPQYLGAEANDDHPPHDSMLAQDLLARIYNGIRANEELWNSSLLVVIYDEHGGFYDHVQPPSAIGPDDYRREYGFDQLGVRVPAVLISPWVKQGVLSTQFDHTSVGKYLCDKWGMEPLGKRMAQAESIGVAIETASGPRRDTPPSIECGVDGSLALRTGLSARAPEPLNENQRALAAVAEHLAPDREDERQFRGWGRAKGTYAAQVAAPTPGELREKALRFLR
jgi:phospholipase C